MSKCAQIKSRASARLFCLGDCPPFGCLFATAVVVTATAVHDEKPRNDIADIATTATHQEKDEDVVIATTATSCSTICKEVVHYVNPLKNFWIAPTVDYAPNFFCVHTVFKNFQIASKIPISKALNSGLGYIMFRGLYQKIDRRCDGIILHADCGVVLLIVAEHRFYMVQFTR